MAEYKKMRLEDVFADIERIMGSELSDDEKSMTLRKKGAAAYENEDDPAAAAYYDESIALGLIESEMLPEVLFRCGASEHSAQIYIASISPASAAASAHL